MPTIQIISNILIAILYKSIYIFVLINIKQIIILSHLLKRVHS